MGNKRKLGWLSVAIGGALTAIGSELLGQFLSGGTGNVKKLIKREKKEVEVYDVRTDTDNSRRSSNRI